VDRFFLIDSGVREEKGYGNVNKFFKRIMAAVLAAAVALAPAVPANAMTKKQVNSEISSINKKIKTDRKKLNKAQKDDWNQLQKYTKIEYADVYCPDPFIIKVTKGMGSEMVSTYYHLNDSNGLTITTGEDRSSKVDGLLLVSDKTYDFYGTKCLEATVAEKPHKADDITARINKNTERKKALKNSTKETISLDPTYTIGVGESLTITPVFRYNTSDINKITWKSSNSKVAKVSKSGKVLGISPGAVTISAKLSVTGKKYKTTVNVVQ